MYVAQKCVLIVAGLVVMCCFGAFNGVAASATAGRLVQSTSNNNIHRNVLPAAHRMCDYARENMTRPNSVMEKLASVFCYHLKSAEQLTTSSHTVAAPATSCPQTILNEWAQSACDIAGLYSCPNTPDLYNLVAFETQPSDSWQSTCAAQVTQNVRQLCGSTFNWLNGGCGQNDWGYGCSLWFYCPA